MSLSHKMIFKKQLYLHDWDLPDFRFHWKVLMWIYSRYVDIWFKLYYMFNPNSLARSILSAGSIETRKTNNSKIGITNCFQIAYFFVKLKSLVIKNVFQKVSEKHISLGFSVAIKIEMFMQSIRIVLWVLIENCPTKNQHLIKLQNWILFNFWGR